MAVKKYYAVRNGRQTGILESWKECELSVKGFSGAVYKSFLTREEAEAYLNGTSGAPDPAARQTGPHSSAGQTPQDPDRDVIVYVDGSYDPKSRRYAYGCIALTPDGGELRWNGAGDDPETAKLRNVAGEMLGAMHAARWAIRKGFASLEIRYDYEGIEHWVSGAWKARNAYTASYADYMNRCGSRIALSFRKVPAHSGHYYNEEVDQLAKAALNGNLIPEPCEQGFRE